VVYVPPSGGVLNLVQLTFCVVVVILLGGCDLIKGSRTLHEQDITFVNNSSLPLEGHGFIGEEIRDDDCEPYDGSQSHVLQPSETYTMHLSTSCRSAVHTSAYAVLVKSYDVQTLAMSTPSAMAKL
jgi:hypothetical protein